MGSLEPMSLQDHDARMPSGCRIDVVMIGRRANKGVEIPAAICATSENRAVMKGYYP